MTVWAILWTIWIAILWWIAGYAVAEYDSKSKIIDLKTQLAIKDMRVNQLEHTVKDDMKVIKKMKQYLRTEYYHDIIGSMLKIGNNYKMIAKNLWLKENTVFKYIQRTFK
jgi:hypothetical protein